MSLSLRRDRVSQPQLEELVLYFDHHSGMILTAASQMLIRFCESKVTVAWVKRINFESCLLAQAIWALDEGFKERKMALVTTDEETKFSLLGPSSFRKCGADFDRQRVVPA